MMNLHYDSETDSLYIELKSEPGSSTREVTEGVVADLDEKGELVGLDIQHAAERFDLSSLETSDLPIKRTLAA